MTRAQVEHAPPMLPRCWSSLPPLQRNTPSTSGSSSDRRQTLRPAGARARPAQFLAGTCRRFRPCEQCRSCPSVPCRLGFRNRPRRDSPSNTRLHQTSSSNPPFGRSACGSAPPVSSTLCVKMFFQASVAQVAAFCLARAALFSRLAGSKLLNSEDATVGALKHR